MNVWIWGPALWDVLHASSFLSDARGMSFRAIAEPLKELLPCRYCRDSYVGFYNTVGPPSVNSAQWLWHVHTLVDTKLASQKLEAIIKRHEWPKSMCDELRLSLEPSVPSFEVMQKRFAVNREEAISFKNLSTSLLALLMFADESPVDVRQPLLFFCMGIRETVAEAKQKNTQDLFDLLDIVILGIAKPWSALRQSVEFKKYGRKYKGNSQYIKAGVCFNGTCV